MSAPTSAGDDSPLPGYYPDPSIPGYVRYWNGAAWVPGTSRPAPKAGEAMPAVPGQTARRTGARPAAPPAAEPPSPPAAASAPGPAPSPAPLEETGPVFLDEEPEDQSGRPEPATAWQADTSRQTGFGGERDHRVSWGGGPEPRAGGAPDPRLPAQGGDPSEGAAPGTRPVEGAGEPPQDGTLSIRPVRPRPSDDEPAAPPRPPVTTPQPPAASAHPPADGALAARGLRPRGPDRPGGTTNRPAPPGHHGGAAHPGRTAPAERRPSEGHPDLPGRPGPHPRDRVRPDRGAGQPPTPPARSAPAPAPGGGSASWAQQVHRLARPEEGDGGEHGHGEAGQPFAVRKPPAEDQFLRAARARAAARPAGLGRRFTARLIDTLVLGALVGVVAAPVALRTVAHVDAKIEAARQTGHTVTVWLVDGTTAVHLAVVVGALLLLGVLCEALPTARWGRTLGKRLCGLKVVDIESHETPTLKAALRRWLVYGVLGLLVIGVANVLWALFDRPWRQCWHDKAAHTFVTTA